jgi:nitrilase
MADPIIVAAAQIRPVLFSLEGSVAQVLAAMAEAAASGVRLVVFPETFLPYYPYFAFVEPAVLMGRSHLKLYEEAVLVDGPEVARIAAAARQLRLHVLLGINERDGGSLYNTQLLIDDLLITNAWSGAKGMGPASRWLPPTWAVSAAWPVGSTTTPWPASP